MRRAAVLTTPLALLGVALMTAGALGPWATAYPRGSSTMVTVGGGGDAWVVLVLALLSLGALRVRSRVALLAVGLPAVGWLVLVGYTLPGALLDSWGWGEATLTWGFGAALLGSCAVLVAAVLRRRGS